MINDVLSKFRNLSGILTLHVKQSIKPKLQLDELTAGIVGGDRVVLGQAITLVESNLEADQVLAEQLIKNILPLTGKALRVGITGVPGVGKSTFIEAFGRHIISEGKKPAVLTIDPSSELTKGSILGDKTRMEELSRNPQAFIRPSASSHVLGGVALKTRETIFLCEAAGYDVNIIETVGVGQSEVAVRNMTDFFLLLMLAGAGDQLQGIKKGIIEIADAIVITKADGDNVTSASAAQLVYQQALQLLTAPPSGLQPRVLTSSAHTGQGMSDIWKLILKHKNETLASGYFEDNRTRQNIAWFTEYFNHLVNLELQRSTPLQTERKKLEQAVREYQLSAPEAARKLLEAYHQSFPNK